MNFLTFVSCILIVANLTLGEDYLVKFLVDRVATSAKLSIQLKGTFGDSSAAIPLSNDGQMFSFAGVKGPFTITTTRSLGDILSFVLTRDNAPYTVYIKQLEILYGGKERIYQNNEIVLPANAFEEYSFPSPSLTNVETKNINTGDRYTIASTIVIKENQNITLAANVTKTISTDVVNYKWYSQKNPQAPAVLISNSSLLIITNTKPDDSSIYFCVMNVKQSILKSVNIEIKVNYLTVQPFSITITGSQIIEEGNNVQITCSVLTNQPNTIFIWTRDLTVISSNNGIMIFESIKRSDSGMYTCMANTSTKFQDSRIMYIRVNFLDNPTINNLTTTSIQISKGNPLSLSCMTNGYPGSIKYAFFKDGKRLDSSDETTTLVIRNPSEGKYSCNVTNIYFTRTTILQVNVSDPSNSTTPVPSPDNDDDEFWTANVIAIIAMGCGFFIIFLILSICICYLLKTRNKKEKSTISYHSSAHFKETAVPDQQDIYYHSNEYNKAYDTEFDGENITLQNENTFPQDNNTFRNETKRDNDTLPSQHTTEKKALDNTSSVSSDENKSSDAGVANGKQKNGVLANGKHRAPKTQQSLELSESEYRKDDRNRKKRRSRDRTDNESDVYAKVVRNPEQEKQLQTQINGMDVEYC